MGNTFTQFASCKGELSTSPQPGFSAQTQRLWALWATRSPVSSSSARRPSSARLELESNAIDGAQLNRSKVQRGVAFIIFMQANYFASQRSSDENQLALPFDLAVAADSAPFEVTAIEWIFEAGRIGSRRGRVNRRWHGLTQGLVRALMVKFCAEVIETALLGSERGRRRVGGFRLEGLVHPFMPPVLLGFTRHDPHRRDAQLDPPHRQPAQAASGQRGERRTIIGQEYLRQAALAKEPLQFTAAAIIIGRNRTAAQQVTAEGVGHGEWITGRAIAGAEPTLEVNAPDIVGRHNRWHASRRRCSPPPRFTPPAEPLSLQQIADGAQRRPVLLRPPCQQLDPQFLRPPARMLLTHNGDRLGLRLGDCPGHHMRCARALCQPCLPLRPKTRQPLVAGLAAHPIFLTQRRHAVFFRHQRVHQSHPQFHGTDLVPRHTCTSCRDGLICYPCCRYILLPMLPVRTLPLVLPLWGRLQRGKAGAEGLFPHPASGRPSKPNLQD